MVVYFRDLILETSDNVYHPDEDSYLLAENIGAPIGNVLDVGTGCGIQALTAAKTAEHVVGVDINPHAVRLAKRNAQTNNVKNADFWVSDLFSDVNGKYDLIIFNPPYLACEDVGELEKAWAGGRLGVEVINRFIDEAETHLKVGGEILLLVSSANRLGEVEKRLKKTGLKLEVTASKKIFFEELYVISAKDAR